MTLSILLSGALGAILASVVAVGASVWREQVRLRGEVAIEIAAWLEDLRATREHYFTARTLLERSMRSSGDPQLKLRWEERFNAIGDRLTVMAQTKKPIVQTAIAYGEGAVVNSVTRVQRSAERLVLQEIRALENGGLPALESDQIRTLRHQFDQDQELLLTHLVRGGSVSQLLHETWAGPSSLSLPHSSGQ